MSQRGAIDWYDNWDMALADALENAGVCLTDEHDVGDLLSLMNQVEEYFDGDLQSACAAIRTGRLTLEPIDDWFQIRRS
jgi:hypothetical protein